MMKPHCDNCDALVDAATVFPRRQLTIQPWGFQVIVVVDIFKADARQQLCAACFQGAVLAFADSLRPIRETSAAALKGGA
jgi:hypothetical protein